MTQTSSIKSKTRSFAFLVIFIAISFSIYFLFFQTKPTDDLITPTPNKQTVADKQTPTLPPLASKYLIKTTFIPQAPEKNWDQPWQDACEESALLTVHYFYQNQDPDISTMVTDIKNMIDFESQNGFSKDVNLSQMAQIAQNYLFYKTEIIDNPSLDQIKSYLISDIPIIVPANGKQLFAENRHFSQGGPYYHNLVILGYNDKKEQFIVHDVGTQHGAYFKYSYSLLLDSIHDFPSSGRKQDINSGPKSILLLLQ